MLVNMSTGQCYRLNRVGAEVWELLKRPCALPELCAEMEKRYVQKGDELQRDVRALVEHLLSEALLEGTSSEGTP